MRRLLAQHHPAGDFLVGDLVQMRANRLPRLFGDQDRRCGDGGRRVSESEPMRGAARAIEPIMTIGGNRIRTRNLLRRDGRRW